MDVSLDFLKLSSKTIAASTFISEIASLKQTLRILMINSKLKIGDLAAEFSLKDQDGKEFHFVPADGQLKVLYFYPKDNTKVCTEQACGFRDWQDQLLENGVKVIGVSSDSPASHLKFKAGHQLNFTLLSDPGAKVRRRYGATSFLGLLPARVSYLIDGNGKICFRHQAMFEGRTHAEKMITQIDRLEEDPE